MPTLNEITHCLLQAVVEHIISVADTLINKCLEIPIFFINLYIAFRYKFPNFL